MKKFFALFIVIALLAVTGSAFAAEAQRPTVSLSTSSVTITRGQAFGGATIGITATPQNEGEITGYALDISDYGASLSGTTVTIPGMTAEATQALTAGSTSTFTVTATETYRVTDDSTGHVSEHTIDGTATFTVSVADPAPEPTPPDPDSGTSGSETPTTNEHTDSITNVTFIVNVNLVNNPTPQNVTAPQTNTIEEYIQTGGQTGGRNILIAVINFVHVIAHATENVVVAIFNNPSFRTFAGNSFTAAADTDNIQVQDNSKLTVTESGKTTAEEVREASAYLQNAGNELTAVTVLPTMSTDTTGVYLFALPFFDEAFYGMTVTGFSNVDEYGVEKGANVFLNAQADSTCAVTTTIPGLETSADILPGFLTFAVYMQAGKTYRPVVAVPITSVQETGVGSTETVTVATRFTEVKTSTFTNYFDESLLAGMNYKRIPGSLISRESWKDSDAETAAKGANANYNIFTLVALPAINGPETETWYVAKVSFDKYTKTAADLYNNAGLAFYPDNVLEDSDTTAKFFKEVNGKLADLTASEIFSSSSRYTQGYVAFKLATLTGATKPAVTTNVVKSSEPASFEIYASSYDVTFTGPNDDPKDVQLYSNLVGGTVQYSATVDKTSGLLAVVDDDDDVLTLDPLAAGTYVVTVTGTNGTDTDTLEINVKVNNSRIGSSSGGCSAGFSALALAVLGAFIARRRK